MKKDNIPKRGDIVELKGRGKTGILLKMNDETLWCTVIWDNNDGPKICHLYELRKI